VGIPAIKKWRKRKSTRGYPSCDDGGVAKEKQR